MGSCLKLIDQLIAFICPGADRTVYVLSMRLIIKPLSFINFLFFLHICSSVSELGVLEGGEVEPDQGTAFCSINCLIMGFGLIGQIGGVTHNGISMHRIPILSHWIENSHDRPSAIRFCEGVTLALIRSLLPSAADNLYFIHLYWSCVKIKGY